VFVTSVCAALCTSVVTVEAYFDTVNGSHTPSSAA
jgi:hypothetical protein